MKQKWKQVCLCSCGAITELENSPSQYCIGCKNYFGYPTSSFSQRFLFGRKNEDGTWELKKVSEVGE